MPITAAQKKLYEVLSPRHYQFCIPHYQRPYAWREEDAKSLIEDLLNAFEEARELEYYLGSIVIIKRNSSSVLAEVVDGQQRLTSLSILIAAVRALMPIEERTDITSLLATEFMGERNVGLKLRSTDIHSDDQFFDKFIRRDTGFDELTGMQAVLPSSQECIRVNALAMRSELEGRLCRGSLVETGGLKDFLGFVLDKACLVVVESTDFESAYRIFSTMNNRGLPLGVSDLIKAIILEAIVNEKELQLVNQTWEQEEADLTRLASLGNSDYSDSRRYFELLFSHIHRIKTKRRSTKSLYEDFRKDVLHIGSSCSSLTAEAATEFVNCLLVPSSDAYEAVLKKAVETGDSDANRMVNNLYLPLLENIGNSDWQPAAISFLSRNKYQLNSALKFFKLLERTAAISLILGENVNKRANRYGPILAALEDDQDKALDVLERSVSEANAKEVLNTIDQDLYGETYAFYVMLRLDSALAEGGISISLIAPRASIEHVAPQTLKQEWLAEWSEVNHNDLKNKIGNLVLLSRRKNSQAQNYDFKKKKNVYFASGARRESDAGDVGKVAAFPSVTRVLKAGESWTPEIVRQNQKEYISLLKTAWEL